MIRRALFIAAAMFFAASLDAAIVAGEVAAAHERLVQDTSFQFEFSTSPARQPSPGWLVAIAELIARIVGFFSPLIRVAFWLGVGLITAGAGKCSQHSLQ